MIDPRTWDRRPVDGGVELRDGCFRVRVRPRLAPRRLSAIVAELCAEHRISARVPGRRRLVTDDGELGAIVEIAGHRAGAGEVELAIAVSGGDPLSCIDAIGPAGTGVSEVVESLARRCGPGLGQLRARMFDYQPPSGWRGLRREASSLWVHPAAPREDAQITVFDARPLTTDSGERLYRRWFLQLDERAIDGSGELETIAGAAGLEGRVRTVRAIDPRGRARVRRAAAFGDCRFIYQAAIDAPATDHQSLATFAALLESFCTLPLASHGAASMFSHWVD